MKIVLNLSNFTYNHDMVMIDEKGTVVNSKLVEMDTAAEELAEAINEYKASKVIVKGMPEIAIKVIEKATAVCINNNYTKSDLPKFEII